MRPSPWRHSKRGIALLLTIIFTLILLSLVFLIHQRIRTALQATQAEGFLDGNLDDQRLGLSRGLTLLETGSPHPIHTHAF